MTAIASGHGENATFKAVARSWIGSVRAANEDSVALAPGGQLLLLADGMGGHVGGALASQLAVAAAASAILELGLGADADDSDWLDMTLRAGFVAANVAVRERSTEDPALVHMGTTLVAMVRMGNQVGIGSIGDSRVYGVAPTGLHQLTRDHTLVQALIDEGMFRDVEEANLAGITSNVLMRAIGPDEQIEPEVFVAPLAGYARYLMCSDGLYGALNEKLIAAALAEDDDLERAADRLLTRVQAVGADDNVSFILVEPATVTE
ncbi:MAG: serine/threonine-protein phosphatase [Chromatiales bacterium]|nr:serine/threonine-protein phosphatase [Chromatiales bacterium]